ncbi:hypothetical protein BaRGS_00001758 [Batillaria attramentaria]|uniref:Uncharacterized protein n=1 Tax=Batillaria attramentaria TaxID=370345 RepID=A0ABD0M6J0_9CAEN
MLKVGGSGWGLGMLKKADRGAPGVKVSDHSYYTTPVASGMAGVDPSMFAGFHADQFLIDRHPYGPVTAPDKLGPKMEFEICDTQRTNCASVAASKVELRARADKSLISAVSLSRVSSKAQWVPVEK